MAAAAERVGVGIREIENRPHMFGAVVASVRQATCQKRTSAVAVRLTPQELPITVERSKASGRQRGWGSQTIHRPCTTKKVARARRGKSPERVYWTGELAAIA